MVDVNNNRNHFRSVVAIGAGLALTLAACGGDDDDAAADTTTATTEASAESSGGSADEVPTAPSALTLADQDGDGTTVTIDGAELPASGFIAIHGDGGGSPGPVIGVSDLLPAGSASGVVVTLDDPLTETGTVFPMVHIDTNTNGIYEFGAVEGVDGPGVTDAGDVAVGPLVITIAGTEAGADSDADSGDAAGDAEGAAITIADFAFGGVTEVPVGTTVVVTNTDGATHTWTAEDGTFDSGALGQDDSFEFTFTEAGEFSYFCNFHPSMTGTIVVTG